MAIKSDIKILIVDDVTTSRHAARQIIHQIGLKQTTEASDGDAAWDCLNQESFGLVVCELKVPKLNALELFTAMKESKTHSHIPFILTTGDTKRDIILMANKAGVNAILVKPFSQQTLTEILVKLFN